MVLRNFIVLEGIDGSGTSTQLNMLRENTKGKQIWFTCEPTTGETGVFLRRMLKGEFSVECRTAAYLFAADRSEHLYGTGGIMEHLDKGDMVISDRYVFSSMAYQSLECGEQLPFDLNRNFPLPEYLFFFDIDPAISMNRIAGRGVTEIYEKRAFQEKVRDRYRRVFGLYENGFSERQSGRDGAKMAVIRIDAERSPEDLPGEIMCVVFRSA